MKKYMSSFKLRALIVPAAMLIISNNSWADTQSTITISYPFPQSGQTSYHLADGSAVIYPASRQNSDVTAFYDYWKTNYVTSAGINMYRIKYGKGEGKGNITVSEGQGYGMLIAVMMAGYDENAQNIFDGLYRYVKAHPSNKDNRLMGWKQPYKYPFKYLQVRFSVLRSRSIEG